MTSDGHSVISPGVLARYAAAEAPGVKTKQRRAARVCGSAVGAHAAGEVQRHVREYLQRTADVTPSSVHVVVDDVQR